MMRCGIDIWRSGTVGRAVDISIQKSLRWSPLDSVQHLLPVSNNFMQHEPIISTTAGGRTE